MKFQLLGLVVAALSLNLVQAVPVSSSELKEKAASGLRLLSIKDSADPVWKTEDEMIELKKAKINFFDVTETYELEKSLPKIKAPAVTYPAPSHQTAVKQLISTLSTSNMQSNLATLTAFNNRYYKSQTGVDSSNWILNTLNTIASGHSGVTASQFKHSWVQSSVIAKIPGKSAGPVTILGAHQDSINLNNPTSGRAPGADDDGTGVVNLIEIFRAVLASGFTPSTPLEFHFYSGEEAGLLGSQAIAANYKSTGISVKAMLQLDMTAYVKPGSKEVIALEADYVDSGLTTFLQQIITSYSTLPYVMDQCGYACSDHASWNKNGYPSSIPFEALLGNDDPYIHGSGDTTSVSGFSWSHSLEFTKVALAFAYELTV
jgi:leucyl aminopeptidase